MMSTILFLIWVVVAIVSFIVQLGLIFVSRVSDAVGTSSSQEWRKYQLIGFGPILLVVVLAFVHARFVNFVMEAMLSVVGPILNYFTLYKFLEERKARQQMGTAPNVNEPADPDVWPPPPSTRP